MNTVLGAHRLSSTAYALRRMDVFQPGAKTTSKSAGDEPAAASARRCKAARQGLMSKRPRTCRTVLALTRTSCTRLPSANTAVRACRDLRTCTATHVI